MEKGQYRPACRIAARTAPAGKITTPSTVCEFLQCRAKAQAAVSRQSSAEHFGLVRDKTSRKPTGNLLPAE
jgi:hypothetical protein